MEHLLHHRRLLHFLVYFFFCVCYLQWRRCVGFFFFSSVKSVRLPPVVQRHPHPNQQCTTVYNVCNRQSIFIPVQDIE